MNFDDSKKNRAFISSCESSYGAKIAKNFLVGRANCVFGYLQYRITNAKRDVKNCKYSARAKEIQKKKRNIQTFDNKKRPDISRRWISRDFPYFFPNRPRTRSSRSSRPTQLSRRRGETAKRRGTEQFVSATKRGETAWIRSRRPALPSLEGEIFSASFLPRPLVPFESRARRENDGPCLSRGIREQAAVCQGDYIQPRSQPAKEY